MVVLSLLFSLAFSFFMTCNNLWSQLSLACCYTFPSLYNHDICTFISCAIFTKVGIHFTFISGLLEGYLLYLSFELSAPSSLNPPHLATQMSSDGVVSPFPAGIIDAELEKQVVSIRTCLTTWLTAKSDIEKSITGSRERMRNAMLDLISMISL